MEPSNELRQALKEYKEGKSEAFTTLYEESSKYVYTCIYKVMSGNDNVQDIINDIMQDTYVEISKYITQLEDEEKFLSWAGTIATRKCYAYLKKNKKYVLLNEEDNTFENLSDSDSIIPEEVMQDREKQRLVREIIETQLTEMQKLCITAYYYNDKKQSEIAEELGIPENTVKTNLSRAKAKIKDGVLDLEKREGTKLYSVAPFLLLLFKEDVQAAVVPKEVTESIMSAVSNLAGAGAGAASKGIIGKIASASLKTKIIAGVVAVGVLGGVAGTVYVAGQQQEEVVAENENIEEYSEKVGNSLADTNMNALDGTVEETVTEQAMAEENSAESTDNTNSTALTADDVKNGIMDILGRRDYVTPTYLDSPTSDMELYEFSVGKYEDDLAFMLWDEFYDDRFIGYKPLMRDYSTYYIECIEKERFIQCNIYYKDTIDLEELTNQFYNGGN